MGAVTRSNSLANLRVGVYASSGAPWHHLALAAAHGARVSVVRAEDVRSGRLASVDVLIVPGGGALAMAGMTAPLGEEGATAIREWVRAGGTYVASCAGSVLPLALEGAAADAAPASRCLRMVEAPLANVGDATLGGLASPGVGRISVRLDPAHPFAAGLPERLEMIHYNGPLFDMERAAPQVEAFAWPEAPTEAFTPAERFLSPREPANPTVLESCAARGAAVAAASKFGEGRAILFGSHPEFGLGPLGLGWGNAASLLVAALASAPRSQEQSEQGWEVRPSTRQASASALAKEVAGELTRAASRFAALAKLSPAGWLDADFAPSFHGLTPRELWSRDTEAAAKAAEAAGAALITLAERLSESALPWLDDEPRQEQDFGAMGLTQLVRRIHAQLDRAERLLPEPPQRPAHAYDLFNDHPYHLVMGSYLSAAGLSAAALLMVAQLHYGEGREAAGIERLLWLNAA